MQNSADRRPPLYRERLAPSLWLLVSAAVVGPMAALTLIPVNGNIALAGGVAVSVLVVSIAILASPVIEVRGEMLHAGNARIHTSFVGEARALVAEDAREARGAKLNARAWHLFRGGIDGVVTVEITDPDDPTPLWVMSSRTPDRLAFAINKTRSS